MTNQTISTVAFLGGGVMLVLFIFKMIPVKQALMFGGALTVVGYMTQPATNKQTV